MKLKKKMFPVIIKSQLTHLSTIDPLLPNTGDCYSVELI